MINNKKKLLILYDTVGWAYYHRAKALQKYRPNDFHVDIDNKYSIRLRSQYDIIFQLCYSYVKPLRQYVDKHKYKCKILSSFNIGWNHRNEWLKSTITYSDMVIINNYEMWDKAGRPAKTCHISNGVDSATFNAKIPYKQRKFKVLWTGSKFHRKVKNYESILLPLSKELSKRKIVHDFRIVSSTGIDRYNHQRMSDWYNLGQCYVVASKTEGTPNPGLEAASCGIPVVSTRVGNMPELIVDGKNGFLCDTNMNSLLQGILKVQKNKEKLSANMSESIKSWHWKVRSEMFYDLFRKILNQ